MTVIRRLDAVLEPTKQAVLDMKQLLDTAGITKQDAALRQAAGRAFTTPHLSPCATCAAVPGRSSSRLTSRRT